MNRTVIALYDDFASANQAVRDLVDHGFPREDISLMASDSSGTYRDELQAIPEEAPSATSEGAGVGAGIGAVVGGIGGLLIGLGALTIPGIGPVIAAGPLAAAISGLAGAGVGAVAGGVTGGLLGALVDMGVPEETAGYYAEGVRRGGTLLTLRTDDTMAVTAVDIMNKYAPVDINERVTQWRESGWAGWNPNAGVYETNETPTLREEAAASGVTTTATDFNQYDQDFRHHYETTLTGMNFTYEQYLPAYRYGYDLATDQRYSGYDWTRVEPDARRYWEERNPGTWDRFKDAVQHAWDEVKATVS